MWRMGSLLVLVVAMVAVVAVTGSGGPEGVPGASAGFHSARGGLDNSLDAVAVDLAELESRLAAGVGPPAESAVLRSQLVQVTDRRKAIVAKLDSLERSGRDSWIGPMIGLRANVADLEYRADALRLAVTDSAVALDSLFVSWLTQAARGLDAAGHGGADSIAGPFKDERGILRARADELEERFMTVSGGSGSDVAERRALGEEMIGMRRRLRALMRAAHRSAPLDRG